MTMLTLGSFSEQYTSEIIYIYQEAVHNISADLYTPAQKMAWAPIPADIQIWKTRLTQTQPTLCFVAEKLAGFAEFKPDLTIKSGYIDCFYVHPSYQRQGVGWSLLSNILQKAENLQLNNISVDASAAAKPFFLKHGFHCQQKQYPVRRNIQLYNYKMHYRFKNVLNDVHSAG